MSRLHLVTHEGLGDPKTRQAKLAIIRYCEQLLATFRRITVESAADGALRLATIHSGPVEIYLYGEPARWVHPLLNRWKMNYMATRHHDQ